jgi:hypothetical protein
VDNFDYDGLTGSEGVGGHAMFRTRHIDQIASESVKANRRLRARTYLDGTHGRWTFKDERHLIALAASQTPLEVVAVKLKRSVDSVGRKTAAMDISLTVLDEPRPKIGLEAKGSKIARIDVDQVREPGEYAFRDGVIRIKRKHLDIWKKDPDATFTLVRFVPAIGAYQIYGLCPDNLL